MKDMESQVTELTKKLEQLEDENGELKVQNLELQAERDILIAKKLELEAKNKHGSSSSSDPGLEALKAKLEAERAQLGTEKIQLNIAQSQLTIAQLQLEDAKNQSEYAQSQLETARVHLEAALDDNVINNKKLEAAKASLEAAKIKFDRATKQLNAAKTKFEAAKKTLEEAATISGNKDKKTNEELVAELSESKAKVESLLAKLRDLEEQCVGDKMSFQEKLDEFKKFLDQEMKPSKNEKDLAAELTETKIQVENLSQKLRDQEKQSDKDKKAMQEKLDEMKKLLDQETKVTKSVKPRIFFDMSTKECTFMGRIVIELFANVTPILAENFRALCTGEKIVGQNGKPLHYKGSSINFLSGYFEGGVYQGELKYEESSILSENFHMKFTGMGDVAMAYGNLTGLSNGVAFYITCDKKEDWNDRYVKVGRVVEVDGMNVLARMMSAGWGHYMSVITNCGEILSTEISPDK